jgi:hypothetical protein
MGDYKCPMPLADSSKSCGGPLQYVSRSFCGSGVHNEHFECQLCGKRFVRSWRWKTSVKLDTWCYVEPRVEPVDG